MTTTHPDAKRKAPLWFWLTLFIILIAAIVVYFITQNDGRADQRNVEKKTTQVHTRSEDRRIV